MYYSESTVYRTLTVGSCTVCLFTPRGTVTLTIGKISTTLTVSNASTQKGRTLHNWEGGCRARTRQIKSHIPDSASTMQSHIRINSINIYICGCCPGQPNWLQPPVRTATVPLPIVLVMVKFPASTTLAKSNIACLATILRAWVVATLFTIGAGCVRNQEDPLKEAGLAIAAVLAFLELARNARGPAPDGQSRLQRTCSVRGLYDDLSQ